MRSLLAALLLVSSGMTGCLDGSFFEQIRNDLEAEDEYEERSLLSERVPFSPAGVLDPDNPIDDPSDASQRWNGTALVPNGTRSLTVTFQINFSSPEQPEQFPSDVPDGEVRVYVEGPGEESEQRSLTRTKAASVGFDFRSPAEGEWIVGMEARGNGTVVFNVNGIVPVEAPASG